MFEKKSLKEGTRCHKLSVQPRKRPHSLLFYSIFLPKDNVNSIIHNIQTFEILLLNAHRSPKQPSISSPFDAGTTPRGCDAPAHPDQADGDGDVKALSILPIDLRTALAGVTPAATPADRRLFAVFCQAPFGQTV